MFMGFCWYRALGSCSAVAAAGCGAALLLAACATTMPAADAPPATGPAVDTAPPHARAPLLSPVALRDLHVDGNAAVFGSSSYLNSGVSVAGLDNRLSYSAGYELQPGALMPSAAQSWSPALPQTVGSQTLSQQLNLDLASLYGAPVLVGARYRQQEALLLSGETQLGQQSMNLSWAPAFAALALDWMPEGAGIDPSQALQCDVSGRLQVPLAQWVGGLRALRLDAGTRACRVVGSDERLAMLSASTWAAGMNWGRPALQTSLRVQGVTANGTAAVADGLSPTAAAPGTGYEFQLSQSRALGDWSAVAGVAWRQAPEAPRGVVTEAIGSPWAASAELSRRLAQASIAASWKRGDPYWFLPDINETADRFAVTVDFSPWAARQWSTYRPTLAMSYNWARYDDATTGGDDQSINWNVSIPWR